MNSENLNEVQSSLLTKILSQSFEKNCHSNSFEEWGNTRIPKCTVHRHLQENNVSWNPQLMDSTLAYHPHMIINDTPVLLHERSGKQG